jgi:hypothetical protein
MNVKNLIKPMFRLENKNPNSTINNDLTSQGRLERSVV